MTLSVFLRACWSFVYLWRNVCQILFLFENSVVYLFIIEFKRFFFLVCSGDQSLSDIWLAGIFCHSAFPFIDGVL